MKRRHYVRPIRYTSARVRWDARVRKDGARSSRIIGYVDGKGDYHRVNTMAAETLNTRDA